MFFETWHKNWQCKDMIELAALMEYEGDAQW